MAITCFQLLYPAAEPGAIALFHFLPIDFIKCRNISIQNLNILCELQVNTQVNLICPPPRSSPAPLRVVMNRMHKETY